MPVSHPFEPVFNAQSRILILGSFPSVQSRAQHFYYGHPRNRFWQVLSAVLGAEVPETIQEKKAFLLSRHIALYDVIQRCEIEGSSDSSIRNAVPSDLAPLIKASDISAVYLNGQKAWALYRRCQQPRLNLPAFPLPSTSPANAAWGLDRLIQAWRAIGDEAGKP